MKKLTMLLVVLVLSVFLVGCVTSPEIPVVPDEPVTYKEEIYEPVITEIESVDTKGVNGVFDLTGYNSATVNSVMASYDTPQKVVAYMASHFTKVDNHPVAWSPYDFYVNKWGDCNDFSTYAIYCAVTVIGMPRDQVYQVLIQYTNGITHMLALFALYPWSAEFNYGYSSNKLYYHDASFYNWLQVVRHHDSLTTAKVDWAILYNYDLDFMQKCYF